MQPAKPNAGPYSTLTARLCKAGDIRLVGGKDDNEGEVEICYNGEWRAVCDDRWEQREATVTCRQLGFASENNFKVTPTYFSTPISLPNTLNAV